ncbi:MAG TPA: tripartite tricarboxylate transporter substrate-binding protein [Alphaproteobacteria bacterium]|nr:tripartite tricarboxylate transporter substrate-binding protein [Alphaproteobacteria bacterium]
MTYESLTGGCLTGGFHAACQGALIAAALTVGSAAMAQPADNFFAGKTITLIVYSDAGSSYDTYARVLAKHMPNHIAGKPTIIVKNMVGAGGLTATRYLYNVAPRDGTTIGTLSRGIPFEPLFGNTVVEFDPLKFVWLGSMSKETTMYVSWYNTKIKKAQDILEKEFLVAGTGAGADSEVISRALNGVLGTKIKLISGYKGASDAALRLEQGEIEGIYWTWNGINTTHPDWITNKKLNLLFQTRATPHPELPDVPLVTVLAKTDEQRQALRLMFARDVLGRPFNAPPELPADRAKTLREAFNASVKDPALLADAQKGKMEIELVTGEEVEDIIRNAYATPKPIVDRVRDAMNR